MRNHIAAWHFPLFFHLSSTVRKWSSTSLLSKLNEGFFFLLIMRIWFCTPNVISLFPPRDSIGPPTQTKAGGCSMIHQKCEKNASPLMNEISAWCVFWMEFNGFACNTFCVAHIKLHGGDFVVWLFSVWNDTAAKTKSHQHKHNPIQAKWQGGKAVT